MKRRCDLFNADVMKKDVNLGFQINAVRFFRFNYCIFIFDLIMVSITFISFRKTDSFPKISKPVSFFILLMVKFQ